VAIAVVGISSVLPVDATATSPSTQHQLLYVANADNGPVTAYELGSSGAVDPVRRVGDPDTPNTFWDPWGVTFDKAGALYVQTFLSYATTFVFAKGMSRPSRDFVGISPDVASVAVDSSGYEYTVGGEGPPEIDVLPPGASGKPSESYHVTPLRHIETDASDYNTWPSVLAVDPADEVLASISRTGGDAIEVYQGGPSGGPEPLRVISGSATGLGACASPTSCDHVAITTAGQMIYALVTTSVGVHVSVFPLSASGDVKPLRTIKGSNTGFAGRVGTGIAVGSDGVIYVLIKTAQFEGKGEVEVFAAHAGGNVAPERTFTDASSELADGEGIALG
jgi:hypothetical protein